MIIRSDSEILAETLVAAWRTAAIPVETVGAPIIDIDDNVDYENDLSDGLSPATTYQEAIESMPRQAQHAVNDPSQAALMRAWAYRLAGPGLRIIEGAGEPVPVPAQLVDEPQTVFGAAS